MNTLWIFSVHFRHLPQKASTEMHSFLSVYVGVEQCSGVIIVSVCVCVRAVLESDTV